MIGNRDLPHAATINGTAGNDRLRGTARADTIYGQAGNDTIDPGRGSDVVYGDAGNDHLWVEGTTYLDRSGADHVFGGRGDDEVTAGRGDVVWLGAGHDLGLRAPTRTGSCATTLEAFTSDQLLVHTDRAEPAYLVRVGERWEATSEDPTGMVRYRPRPGRQAAGSTVRTGYWHWREVVTGSPDGRRLVAQVHFPGDATWTHPVTVAVAPRGLHCFEIAPTSTPDEEPFYVSMRCRYRPSPGTEWVYVRVHAVTEDGITWASAFGDQGPTRVGEDLYFGGAPAHRWTPERGLSEVGPPVPANSETFQVDDGTLVLVSARPHGSRCRLVVRVSEPGDPHWSAPQPNPDPFVPPANRVGRSGSTTAAWSASTSPQTEPDGSPPESPAPTVSGS